jgi:hypothetical protein
MAAKFLFFITMSLMFFSVNADVRLTRCKDGDGRDYYSDDENIVKQYVIKGLDCKELVFETESQEDFEKRVRGLRKLDRLIYEQKVRETAKFLDDVEAARKRR